jgi:hypothetical protein
MFLPGRKTAITRRTGANDAAGQTVELTKFNPYPIAARMLYCLDEKPTDSGPIAYSNLFNNA